MWIRILAFWLAVWISVCSVSAGPMFAPFMVAGPSPLSNIWKQLNIGGGGYVTGVTVANDNTKYVRTDVYGDYLLSGSKWEQCVTFASMPSNPGAAGSYEIAVAPSNSAHVDMLYLGALYDSTNFCQGWTAQSNFTVLNADSNGAARLLGRHMEIDPANENVLVAGGQNTPAVLFNTSTNTQTATSLPPPTGTTITTSPTSNAIGTGSKTFTVGTCLGFVSNVQAYETSNTANVMLGTITSCTGTTLVMNSVTTFGSGTHTDWTFFDPKTGLGTEFQFDPTSATTGGKTQGIFACVNGTGVFATANAGTTWTLTTSGPTTCAHMREVGITSGTPFSFTFVTDLTNGASATNLWRYGCTTAPCASSGTWLQYNLFNSGTNPLENLWAIDYDPTNCVTKTTCHIFVMTGPSGGQNYIVSTDSGGTTYSDWVGQQNQTVGVISTDVPWQACTAGIDTCPLNIGDFRIDSTGLATVTTGTGVVTATLPTTRTAFNFTDESAGIEELVGRQITCPPGQPCIFLAEDFAIWNALTTTTFPTTYTPSTLGSLTEGTSMDYSSQTPATMVEVGTNNNTAGDASYVTTNGAISWSSLSSPVDSGSNTCAGGMIAAQDTGKYIRVPLTNGVSCGDPYCLISGSWVHQSINSIPAEDGWNFASFNHQQRIAADRVNANTYYAYNAGATAPGIYVTTDNCTSWFKITFNIVNAFSVQMKADPLIAGHVFWTNGPAAFLSEPFYECNINLSGKTGSCSAVSNVFEVFDFAFGASKPGGAGQSCIYFTGYYGSGTPAFGDWVSCDDFATVQALGNDNGGFPITIDSTAAVGADLNNFGRAFKGYLGSGFQQYNYLLNRDLDPASNDNAPLSLSRAS